MTVQVVMYYKCDRCKKRIENKGELRSIRFSKLGYSDVYRTQIEDLCEDCQESFKRWLRGEE